jgi:UPF0755 protein
MMKKYLTIGGVVLAILLVLVIYPFYKWVFAPSVRIPDGDTYDLYIPTGADYTYVGEKLLEDRVITNPEGFQRVARQMNYHRHVYPGRYVLHEGMSNRELIQLLRSGSQTPIQFTFVKFRRPEDFALHTSERLELSKTELMAVLEDEAFLSEFGLTPETALGIMIPNTYEMYWSKNKTSAKEFVRRMYKEYRAFWNDSRRAQRQRLGLTRQEVMTLASIVEEETNKADERATVAGVYLNRIRKKMRLEADPTVKYAVGDFTIKRVLNSHLEYDSPYNTYMYAGIPPGPICTPSIPSIDAVLADERHDYIFFCAKADGSGYHHFSKTLSEHLAYARNYHRFLDTNRIGFRDRSAPKDSSQQASQE